MDSTLLVRAELVSLYGGKMNKLQKAGYIAEYKSKAMQEKLEQSIKMIASHPNFALSTSWGKDSVSMLHLAAQIHPKLKVVNARYPNPAERFEDMDRVRDLVLSRSDLSGITYREVDTPGEWEMYERAGGFAEAMNREHKSAAKWWKDNFTKNMNKAMQELGCDGVFIGLRADESHARRMNVFTHGDDYQRKDGLQVALPIAHWSGRHVWAYLVRYSLSWMRIYDQASCSRERARSGFVFATGGASAIRRHGVWEDWKRIYPIEFNAWMRRFPELEK